MEQDLMVDDSRCFLKTFFSSHLFTRTSGRWLRVTVVMTVFMLACPRLVDRCYPGLSPGSQSPMGGLSGGETAGLGWVEAGGLRQCLLVGRSPSLGGMPHRP